MPRPQFETDTRRPHGQPFSAAYLRIFNKISYHFKFHFIASAK